MDDMIMLSYDKSCIPEGLEHHNLYEAKWNDPDEEIIKNSSHEGSDYGAVRDCFAAIRGEAAPVWDVHRAVAMSSVAILGHRSLLQNGVPYDIPDFRDEEQQKLYENDHDTPFYDSFGGKPTIPASSHSEDFYK